MKIILHIDIDSFFASVEENDHKVHNIPIGVCKNHDKSIICSANYEARKYGVKAAMPVFKAKQLCNKIIFYEPRIKRYQEISKLIYIELKKMTPKIEQASIDEWYIDFSDKNQLIKNPKEFAICIQKKIYQITNLSVSIGISYNKFFAKIASKVNKPNGIFIIDENNFEEIILPMKIQEINMLGKKTTKKLNEINIYTVSDLINFDDFDLLTKTTNKSIITIIDWLKGNDKREILINYQQKSISCDKTFINFLSLYEEVCYELLTIFDQLHSRLINEGFLTKKIHILVQEKNNKNRNFNYSFDYYTNNYDLLKQKAIDLIQEINFDYLKCKKISISFENIIKEYQLLDNVTLFDDYNFWTKEQLIANKVNNLLDQELVKIASKIKKNNNNG